MPVEIYQPVEPLWDFDPDDKPLSCDISKACRFTDRSRAVMYEHYRQRHRHAIYLKSPTDTSGWIHVGEPGWDDDKVWQSLDFYFRGYDETWWDSAEVTGAVNCKVEFRGEPAWHSVRRKLIAAENSVKECA